MAFSKGQRALRTGSLFVRRFPFLLLVSGHGMFHVVFLRAESQRSWIKIESLAICYTRPVRQDTSPLPLHQAARKSKGHSGDLSRAEQW